jgi:hypothetical protein
VGPTFSWTADACCPSGDHDCGFDFWIDFSARSKQMSCDSGDAHPGLIGQCLDLVGFARLVFANVTCCVVVENLAVLNDGRKLAIVIRIEIETVTGRERASDVCVFVLMDCDFDFLILMLRKRDFVFSFLLVILRLRYHWRASCYCSCSQPDLHFRSAFVALQDYPGFSNGLMQVNGWRIFAECACCQTEHLVSD